MTEPVVWFNASCSKCRTTQSILDERGVEASYLRYLDAPPDTDEIHRVLAMLGSEDPRVMARTGEDLWTELGLDEATDGEIIEAMSAHPILIERPIVIVGSRAVVARPPERVLELLDTAPRPPSSAST